MADLNLVVSLNMRNKGRSTARGFRRDLKSAATETRSIARESKLVAGRWRDISKTSGINRHLLRQQTREYERANRQSRRLSLSEARRSEELKKHNRLMRQRARDSLGGGRRGPGFDPDAPATNLSIAAGAADRFGAAGERAITSIATAGLEFGTAVREVQTLTDNISGEQISKITRDAAKEFGALPTEQVKTFYQIVSAGTTDAAGATNLLAEANRVALGGVTDTTSGFDALNAIMKPYGIAAEDAATASDALFTAVRLGKTTIPELAQNLSQVTPLAAEAGISYNEVLAGIATITSETGASTDKAAVQLGQFAAKIVKPSKQAEKEFKRLGIRSVETGKKFRSMKDAVTELGVRGFLAAIQSSKKFGDKSLGKLFENVRSLRAVLALTSDEMGGKFNTNMLELGDASGAAAAAVDKFSDDPALKLKKMNAEWEEMKISLSKDILPALVDTAKAVRPMIKDFAAFVRQNPWIAKVALASVAGAKVAGPLLHAGSALAALSGGRGFGAMAGQRGAPSALLGGGQQGARNRASGAIGGSIGVVPALLGAATAGWMLGKALDDATGASTHLADFMFKHFGGDHFGKEGDIEAGLLGTPGAVGAGDASLLTKRREQLAAVQAQIAKERGTGAVDALGFGLVGKLRKAGSGLGDEEARLRADVRRLETETGERGAAGGVAADGFQRAAATFGLEIKVDQDARVNRVNVTKKPPASEVEVETDLGVN